MQTLIAELTRCCAEMDDAGRGILLLQAKTLATMRPRARRQALLTVIADNSGRLGPKDAPDVLKLSKGKLLPIPRQFLQYSNDSDQHLGIDPIHGRLFGSG